MFSEFHRLISGKANRVAIIERRELCRKTLSVKFKPFFNRPISSQSIWSCLPPTFTKTDDPWVLGIDGKWLRRKGVVMIYRDVTHKENLFWSYHQSESYLAIHADFEKLVEILGDHLPLGVVSDWKGAIVAAVSSFLPHTPHQRCLTHVAREAKRLLPKNSGFLAISGLRTIAKQLPHIKTEGAKRSWLADLIEWEKTYGYRLKEKTINPRTVGKKWWYTPLTQV